MHRSLACLIVLFFWGLGVRAAVPEDAGPPANDEPRRSIPVPPDKVAIYPAPRGEALSADYALTVDGKPGPVYACRVSAVPLNQVWPGYQRPIEQTELASFAGWDMSGPVAVSIECKRPVCDVVVRPASYAVRPRVSGGVIRFTLDRPRPLVVEVNGAHHALHLFASPPEAAAPKPGDAGVRYFGPGVHRPGRMTLASNEGIYIAGGAVVYGSVHARGASNIAIRGRGILDTGPFPRVPGSPIGIIGLTDCRDVTIEGIVLRDSDFWCCAVFGCRGVTIANLKVVGQWRYNSDGIDICNSQDVTVRDCFLRTFDDSISLKGLFGRRGAVFDDRPVRNVRVSRCVFWNDWGHALVVGFESCAPEFRDIAFEDCDIVRSSFAAMAVNHGDRAAMQNIRFEDIRVEADGRVLRPRGQGRPGQRYVENPQDHYSPALVAIQIARTPYEGGGATALAADGRSVAIEVGRVPDARNDVRGTLRGVVLKDISVTGPDLPGSSVRGFDAQHTVEDVTIENLRINGRPVAGLAEARLSVGPFVEGIRFLSGKP